MQRGSKYLLLAVLLISFAVLAPTPAAAGDGIYVIMDEAYYADADGDGLEDDIVVRYEIIPSETENQTEYVIELYCTLTLPSGVSFVYECAVVTSTGCSVTQIWFDAVSESGWYKYSVYAYTFDGSVDPGYNEIIFDPPEANPGTPTVDVIIVENKEYY